MDVGKPKKKRNELELLLGNGDGGGFAPFSPRVPAVSISSPAMAEVNAETDEQLARRLHEELNGTRMTRRGSRAVTEETMPVSPSARGMASPQPKPKVDTPRAHGGQARTSLPSVPAPATTAGVGDGSAAAPTEAATGEAGRKAVMSSAAGGGSVKNTTGGAARGRSGSGDGSAPTAAAEGTTEGVKRKRNSVPARELHLLLQQAASSAGRNESALSPTRSTRGSAFASGRVDAASGSGGDAQQHFSQHPTLGNQPGTQAAQRRDTDRSSGPLAPQGQQSQHQSAGSAVSAPMAAPTSPRVPLPPPCPPSLLPPKLKQRYLAGLNSLHQATPGSASASASNVGPRADGVSAGSAAGLAPTTVTPSCILGGARNSLLSGQSIEGSSTQSHTQSQSQSPSWVRDGSGTGATYGGPEALSGAAAAAASAASLAGATARPQAAAGATAASVGGCSSTDETETDNDNSGSAAATGAAEGGPSATSPKASIAQSQQPPPPLQVTASASQKQRQAQADGGDARSCQAKHSRQSGSGDAAAAELAEPAAASAKAKQGSSVSGPLKVPKLPMIRAGRGWYRGRLLRESVDGERVLVDVPGAPIQADGAGGSNGHHNLYQHLWLPAASDRIWRGSYKGKDWKYLGDGAWEPKPGAFKRGKLGSSSNGLPLPLPQWAADGVATGCVGAEAGETEGQQPSGASVGAAVAASTGGAGSGGNAGPSGKQRSKRDRSGWSSPEDDDDDDTSEEADEQQERRHRGGQEKHRRSSPPGAAFAVAGAAATVGTDAGLGSASTDKAGAVPATPAAADAGVGNATAEDVEVTDVGMAADAGGLATPLDDAMQTERETAAAPAAEVMDGSATSGAAKPTSAGMPLLPGMPLAVDGSATRAPVPETGAAPVDAAAGLAQDGDIGLTPSADSGRGGSGGGTEAADSEPVATAKLKLVQSDSLGGVGNGNREGPMGVAEAESDGEIKWAPGVPYPRTRRPRRARRRQQRVRTPFDGMQFPSAHHHAQHNPYSFYAGLSGEESGGDGYSSDPEHGVGVGGRRGSDANGDGTAGHHHGSRRRAAARAAAVAAAAARAEAEAEEEEQEEILLGRRPPRRDKFNTHIQQGGANRRSSHHHRSRSAARPDYYLYGDSSGNMDDPYGVDTSAAHGNASSARPRAGSRGNSQPAPEPYASGGSGGWETAQWQVAGGPACDRSGAGQAPQQPRNRRKGKPSRSRMDGEGDVWCCWEDDWELEAAGGAWARMPEVLRRLYYAPCPAADGSGGGAGQRGGMCRATPHRQSGGGAYYGALQGPNKRRRVYDEDPAISPDDLDLEVEVDDHEHDADYLPPYGAAGAGRRGSGFGGGRRCSANGGGAATKRQRIGEAAAHYQFSSSFFQQHQMGQYGDTEVPPPPRPRILVSCGWGPESTATAAGGGTAPARGNSGSGCIPSGLAGLLEAALGHDATAPAAATIAAGTGMTSQPAVVTGPAAGDEVKKECGSEPVASRASVGLDGAGATALRAGCAPPLVPLGDSLGAHVALSDSSAAPSGVEEGKFGGGGAATAAVVATVRTAVDASGPTMCADVSASGLSQQQMMYGGGSCGGAAAGGSPAPPGQLRPNTPTRAKRTGRPPSAGAPLPKLPALSSTASLRLQMAGLGAPRGLQSALPATAADDQVAGVPSGSAAPATTTDALLSPRVSLGPEALQLRGEEACGRPVGQGGFLSADEGPRGDAVCSLWHAVGGDGGNGRAAQPGGGMPAAAAGEMATMDTTLRSEVTCHGSSVFTTAVATAVAIDVLAPGAKCSGAAAGDDGGAGCGSSCCVMDAIGALQYDKQPAMQQLAMRAQLELDTIGLMLASHHPQYRGSFHDEPRLLSSRAGSSGRASGLTRSGSMSGAMSPAAPDPLITALPSVEVVVSLFSARTPYGSPQQALADLVGGAAALPLFR